jgi:hypothetical protein
MTHWGLSPLKTKQNILTLICDVSMYFGTVIQIRTEVLSSTTACKLDICVPVDVKCLTGKYDLNV